MSPNNFTLLKPSQFLIQADATTSPMTKRVRKFTKHPSEKLLPRSHTEEGATIILVVTEEYRPFQIYQNLHQRSGKNVIEG